VLFGKGQNKRKARVIKRAKKKTTKGGTGKTSGGRLESNWPNISTKKRDERKNIK